MRQISHARTFLLPKSFIFELVSQLKTNYCAQMNKILIPILLILLFLGLAANPVFSQIYQTINEDGSVSYSDQPPLNEASQEVQLRPTIIQPAVSIPVEQPVLAAQNSPSIVNKSLRINAPLDESVLHGPDNQVAINVSVTPAIESHEQLQLLHNGQAFGAAQSSSQWNLFRLNPGTHKIAVQLVDETGRVLNQSSDITLYVIL